MSGPFEIVDGDESLVCDGDVCYPAAAPDEVAEDR